MGCPCFKLPLNENGKRFFGGCVDHLLDWTELLIQKC
jgi:hypothetical protein